jgi:hypothetical protein
VTGIGSAKGRRQSSAEHTMPEAISKRGLSIPAAADYIGSTVSFVRHKIWSGELPYVVFGKRHIIDIRDLDSLIETEKRARTLDQVAR